MKHLRYILPLTVLSALLFFASCTSEDYDTGDGKYSYMCADFVEAYTDNNGKVTRATTDDDETLAFSQPFKIDGMSTPDSVYRILLYYNKVENDIKPLGINLVYVPVVHDIKDAKDKSTDPVQFDSSWMSRNGRYINLGLTVKAGTTNNDSKQSLGMALDRCTELPDGTKEVRLILIHNQNGMPEYYSVTTYMSIVTDKLPCGLNDGDKVVVAINTYKGEIEKTFQIKF